MVSLVSSYTLDSYPFGISFIIAGAIGNLIDRIFLGAVIDFLDFMIGNFHWYVFNLADSYVTVGMVLVLIDSIILEKKRIILLVVLLLNVGLLMLILLMSVLDIVRRLV